ncbi:MAG: methyltransferase, partial [Deltaproteobacteria bacterium]|nr:methyltransferase [Deltaproteobacteria bacterium]
MIEDRRWQDLLCAILVTLAVTSVGVAGESYQPKSGQPGKDVVWVGNPQVMVQKMLDMAGVTASDFVVDLGSGDGR